MTLHFSTEELALRRSRALDAVAKAGLHGLPMFKQESMYYLTGHDTFGFCFFQCLYLGRDGRMTLVSRTPDARARGYQPGRFSFNVKGGRCEACQGDGLVKIEMHFLPDVYVTCDVCKAKRYNRETLDIKYKGASIAGVLDMTVREALAFFDPVPVIKSKLGTLDDVGLDYVRLGQSATTLSGGEAQRVKLATELSRRATGRTLYILDEPTTGLHFADIRRLLEVLNQLVDQGNTVVIIEHNVDVIKTADWVIDLGPEGGNDGGRLVAAGTPEDVARQASKSYTGQVLKKALL
jgi:excinuclease ABC subunit A